MFPPDYKDMKWWRRMGKPVSPTSTEQGLAQARTVEYPLSLQPRNDGPKNTATVRSSYANVLGCGRRCVSLDRHWLLKARRGGRGCRAMTPAHQQLVELFIRIVANQYPAAPPRSPMVAYPCIPIETSVNTVSRSFSFWSKKSLIFVEHCSPHRLEVGITRWFLGVFHQSRVIRPR